MAFTSRAKRSFGFGAPTPAAVGPGAYNVPSGIRVGRRSAAPFGTSSMRAVHLPPAGSPGPGSYDVAQAAGLTIQTRPAHHAARGRVVPFGSRASRFPRSHARAARPGAPEHAASLAAGPHSGAAASERLASALDRAAEQRQRHLALRIPRGRRGAAAPAGRLGRSSVPSIPASRSGHGYDEDDRGNLVPYPADDHAAVSKLGPGPSTYTPRDTILRSRVPAPSLAGYAGRKSSPRASAAKDTPGPGSYAVSEAYSATITSNTRSPRRAAPVPFNTTARRVPLTAPNADALPGPGSYELDQTPLYAPKSFNVTYDDVYM
ncbi:uncharacterized protein AMSG_08999 [Thecamonas trahens ATCC 50062]|uniref:Uncharacterized protein n=1 Tax=Thecamonas trahens ATCC 50062 TaxID=461836 RepID=A0A0L0DLD3_THETB|nr:hypothetical protein AMSG_08999 [Thecamonas trahens ATCC 50062]KNC52851.1 hypothetical protein AMSG_08999 [Thecamonas trahens ATCC 50062]|eukprot:XP_013754953.1 hypothetical protein AMSG_08999 [Thecamonas trahens ATCC 50062]